MKKANKKQYFFPLRNQRTQNIVLYDLLVFFLKNMRCSEFHILQILQLNKNPSSLSKNYLSIFA